MGKYMMTAHYTSEGLKGLLAEGGRARKAAVEAMTANVGGSVEMLYWMSSNEDCVVICDLPNDEAAAAIALTVGAAGAAAVRTTVLLSADQLDAAAKNSPAYRAPGA